MHFSVLLTLGMMLFVTDALEDCFCKMPNFLTGYETQVVIGDHPSRTSERAFGIDFSRPSLRYVIIRNKNTTLWADYPRNLTVIKSRSTFCTTRAFNRGALGLLPEQCVPNNQIQGSPDDAPGIKTFFDDTRNPSMNYEVTYKVDDHCIPTSIFLKYRFRRTQTSTFVESTFSSFVVHSDLSLAYFLKDMEECWDDCDNPYLREE